MAFRTHLVNINNPYYTDTPERTEGRPGQSKTIKDINVIQGRIS